MPETISGVAFNAPPPDVLPGIMASIGKAVAALPPEKTGALVGLVNETGANAVIVTRLAGGWDVQAWIGKRWDTSGVQYGAALRKVW